MIHGKKSDKNTLKKFPKKSMKNPDKKTLKKVSEKSFPKNS